MTSAKQPTSVRRSSICLPLEASATSLTSSSFSCLPMASSTAPIKNVYLRGRGSFTGNPPHAILAITQTPPPLPPPPPNPQLTPLKPRSRSQQWSSSRAFGIGELNRLPGKHVNSLRSTQFIENLQAQSKSTN